MSNPNAARDTRPKRKRARPLPHVNIRNLAIEKQRREAMNENLLDLARLVPSLASARRLTKVLIVNKSIEHLRQQRAMCVAAAEDVQDVMAENRRLVEEVNALRAQVRGPTAPLDEARPATAAMAQLMSVKDEVYGTFPAGFAGDNWNEDPSESQRTGVDDSPREREVPLAIDGLFPGIDPSPPAELLPQDDIDVLLDEFSGAAPVLSLPGAQSQWTFDTPTGTLSDPLPLSHPLQPPSSGPTFADALPSDRQNPFHIPPSFWPHDIGVSNNTEHLRNLTRNDSVIDQQLVNSGFILSTS